MALATVGSLATNVASQMDGISSLISIMAYMSGGMFAVKAVLRFKEHSENPERAPLSAGMVLLMVGVSLLFLPEFLKNSMGDIVAGGSGLKLAQDQRDDSKAKQAAADSAALEAKTAANAKAAAAAEKSQPLAGKYDLGSTGSGNVGRPKAQQMLKGEWVAPAPAAPVANYSPEAKPMLKEPSRGSSADGAALGEVLGLLLLVGLGATLFIRSAAKKTAAERASFDKAVSEKL